MESATWETCTLRKMLKGHLKLAIFSEEEMKAVMLSDVSADENPIYDTNQGNDTKDKLFLLSIKEVEQYFVSKKERWCKPTKYAYSSGFYEDEPDFEYGWWWLRSAGGDSEDVARVKYDGSIDCFGTYMGCLGLVRHAFWLNLQIYYTISEK